jgi:hypothetical protein
VAIDKFTKWIEVKPVTCPKADKVLDFLDELVHRYGLPHLIIATSRNALSMLAISSPVASRTRKDYTSSARHGKVPSQLQRWPDQARIASRHLKAKTSATRGTSTSSVGSTSSLSTTLGAQVYTTTSESFAVSGLRVQALVSGLLYSEIQR